MTHAHRVPKQRILTAALLLALSSPTWAQDATATSDDAKDAKTDAEKKAEAEKAGKLDTVVVKGIRHSIETSIATKKSSNSIVEAITAEDIGKLPDASVAESLARLPGLTGQRGSDGRVNVISIRGLSPAFSGALLNGREIVSSNDGRAVEYDQFPAELIGGATVYKTPNAALIGQGLSGTVNLMARRPLDSDGRQVVLNLRLDDNSLETQADGVASPMGKRFSASYINQNADKTFGWAIGFAHLDQTTQLRTLELDNYGDYTPYGVPIAGTVPSLYQAPGVSWGPVSQALLPMFWTGSQSTKSNKRDGLMAVLEWAPDPDFHSELDLYYSKFDTHEVGGKLTENMFASWGQFYGLGVLNTLSDVGTTQVGQNTYATSGHASALPTTTTNWDTRRKDTIWAVGWNTSFKMSDEWTAVTDFSWSKDTRDEKYQEVYAGPWDNNTNNWAYGAFDWNIPVDGSGQSVTPSDPTFLSDPNRIHFGDVVGFDYVPGEPRWTGVIRTPHVEDEIKTARLSLSRGFDGWISKFTGGINYTQRDKNVESNENRLLYPAGSNHSGQVIPPGSVLSPFDMSWMGVDSFIRLDVPYLVSSGALTTKPALLGLKANDSSVHEKIWTAFAMIDIDTTLGKVPIRGNFGVQAIHTKQAADGWQYFGNPDNVDFNLLVAQHGETSYTDFLPSLNLVAEFQPDLIGRLGIGVATARPQINDLRAGSSTPTVDLNPGPNQGKWSTSYAGNPYLKPWKAVAFDLSIEKYFGTRSYISLAAFRKNLISYITYGVSAIDNSDIPLPDNAPPGFVADQYGPSFQPLNGNGGRIQGVEAAASLEGGLLWDKLDGFGLVVSASQLSSTIRDQRVDQNSNQVIPGSKTSINGLSGISNSVTIYYEKHGFSARVSQRYRQPFTATTRDIFFRPTTRQQGKDKVVDFQMDYSFAEGSSLEGMTLLFQAYNVTNSKARSYKTVAEPPTVPDPTQLVPNYTYEFGRVLLFGVNYKF